MPETVNIEIGDSAQQVPTGTENLSMHKAVNEGDLVGLKLLLTKEDPTKVDEKGRTPLHWACCYGNDNTDAQAIAVEMVKEILKSLKDKLCLELLDRADKKGRTGVP
ncbi:unnamed protein product [Orchesella dallaii]|uniref:Uncharacterized protein n=1 Tax=Orchesella dallaii TaxID=48710 RepID=A0ABP1RQ82_9HEXA